MGGRGREGGGQIGQALGGLAIAFGLFTPSGLRGGNRVSSASGDPRIQLGFIGRDGRLGAGKSVARRR